MGSETKEVIIPVSAPGVEQTDKQIKDLTKTQKSQTEATQDSTEATEEQGETLVDVAKDAKLFGVSINSISSGLKGTVKVLKTSVTSLKAFKIALIATGVGAIVVALGTLVVLLTQTQGGLDFVTKAGNLLGAVFNVLIDRVISFGQGFLKILSGNFAEGFNEIADSFKGIGAEIREDIKVSNELSDAFADLVTNQIAFISTNQRLKTEFKTLNKLVEDTTKSFIERIDAAERGLEVEKERARIGLELAAEELRIVTARNALSTETNATLREEAELRKELFLVTEQSDEIITTAQNKLNILVTQRTKQIQDEIKASNDLIKVQQKGLDLQIQKQGIVIAQKAVSVESTGSEEEAEIDLANTIAGIGAALAQFGKAGAIAAAFTQLGVAIARVFGQTGVFGFAAIPGVIAAIAPAIASIKAAKIPATPTFAQGGYIGGELHNGPHGGTHILAERGEYMISRRAMQDKNRAAIAQALNNYGQSKGFRFQEGGFIGARGQISFAEMNNLLSRIDRSVLVTEDLNVVQNSTLQIEERATL